MELEHQDSTTAGRQMSPATAAVVIAIQKVAAVMTRRWLFLANGFWAMLLIGAVMAPLLMAAGHERPGRMLYTIYSFTCHQLPERSFFLFSPDGIVTTYGESELIAAGANPTTLLTFREYIGSEVMGWKLAFSDRMVGMYGGAFLAGLLYWLFSRRRRMRPIPIWLMFLMVLPMAVDGTSHLVSEVTGLGFRAANEWAVPIFGSQPAEFYTGTTLGTLNSNLRLITGTLFGIGMMLFAYPLMGLGFDDLADEAEQTLKRNRARLAAREGAK